MRTPPLDRVVFRRKRLAEYLAAEEPAVSARLAAPAEEIEASGRSGGSIEVETLEQVGKQGIHR